MPNQRNIILFTFSGLLLLLAIAGCSTKKNTWTRRAYHSVTCHYNVYWNGEQSLKEAEQTLKESNKDNYNEILRVYNYGTKKTAQGLYPKLDRTIKKASIGIQKHSMFFGGEEKIKWVKYSYFMMGKAHFYKHDYISARRVFDYVAKQYEDDPIHYNGYLWLAKTFIETENYAKAEAALNFLQSRLKEKDFPYDVKRDLPLVSADLYIAMGKYDMAYGFLERGIELGNKRDVIIRANFILGQINQMEGNLNLASEFYKRVIKMNPDYIMDFEARINMAKSYDEGTGDSKNINKVLLKMVKNFQYNEFKDQIYYALAEVALKDHNIEKAVEYLKLSVSSSKNDDFQKTTSSLTLADLYFERGNYPGAQAYYDTAASFLPEDYPNFDAIKNKAAVLSELVTYAQTIQTQDSLQKLSAMDSTQLYAVIDGIIENYKKEKEKKEQEVEEAMSGGGVEFVDIGGGGRPGQSLGGKWYFYNPQAISMGRSAFIQKWGNRKLEDYWFITDKRGLLQGSQELQQEEGEIVSSDSVQGQQLPSNPETRAFYLVNIPSTPEAIRASDSIIVEAYKKLGFLYLEKLNDTAKALQTYLDFQSRYPDNKYRLESWYALYKIYNETKNTDKANYYKDLIVSNYPDSDYAQVILDPDYYTKLNAAKNESAKLYERTYKAFEREQYYRVITYANRAMEQFPEDTALMPKFLFLRAISIGKVDVPDSLYAALDHLIVTYPKSQVTPMAQSVLRMLQLEYGLGITEEQKKALEEEAAKGEETSPFTFAPQKMHLFMLIINSTDVKINPLKVRLSDFKKKYFRLKRLNVKSLMLDNQRTLITIGNFQNKAAADDFYSALKNDKYVLSGLSPDDYQMFTISINNYPIFYREKNVKLYEEFFNKYYSNFDK
ncbi:MAG: tetratricopeptide repeat protein [Chlorobi bacterium]|nr:tetratricopeptide repeat protein [Chlorobiota bacterium]